MVHFWKKCTILGELFKSRLKDGKGAESVYAYKSRLDILLLLFRQAKRNEKQYEDTWTGATKE